MRYEWDDAKNQHNQIKHAISFELVYQANWNLAHVVADAREGYNEVRYIAYVPINNRVHIIAYTMRGDNRRIISMRKANQREVRIYEQYYNI